MDDSDLLERPWEKVAENQEFYPCGNAAISESVPVLKRVEKSTFQNLPCSKIIFSSHTPACALWSWWDVTLFPGPSFAGGLMSS